MNRSELARVVALLSAAYPNAQISVATSEVYEEFLADLEARHVLAAVRRLVNISKFLPTIAEIRETARDELHEELETERRQRERALAKAAPPPLDRKESAAGAREVLRAILGGMDESFSGAEESEP